MLIAEDTALLAPMGLIVQSTRIAPLPTASPIPPAAKRLPMHTTITLIGKEDRLRFGALRGLGTISRISLQERDMQAKAIILFTRQIPVFQRSMVM